MANVKRKRNGKQPTKRFCRALTEAMTDAAAALRNGKLHFLAAQLNPAKGVTTTLDVCGVKGRVRAVSHLLRLNPPDMSTYTSVIDPLNKVKDLLGLNRADD